MVTNAYKRCCAGRAIVLAWGLLIAGAACAPSSSRPAAGAWQDDWSVHRGFAIEIDTDGYTFPSALAFVPDPGPGPKDPLYFVTELHGSVKVVTNDRSVHTFARDFFTFNPVPGTAGDASLELGLAGICLDPARGYVFVTFVHHDAQGVLRNNIVRFSTTPGRLGIAPTAQVDFGHIFAADRSHLSHQIGPCQVSGDWLYVGVGDGEQPEQSQSLGSTLGKVLRLTVDGDPVPGNPFFDASASDRAASYVWAYGLRNPFGLKLAEGRMLVADNGNAIDRLLEVHRGENYLWDGTDHSIGAVASAVLSPGRGVTQVSYHPPSSKALPPEFHGMFFVVVSGDSEMLASDAPPSILAFRYAGEDLRLDGVPRRLLAYRGTALQTMTAADVGPDGLYFTALFPNSAGTTPVYRVRSAPDRPHPHVIGESLNPRTLMAESGCFGCHSFYENRAGTRGPVLDREVFVPRLEARLASREYEALVARVDALDQEPFVSFRDRRREVASATGMDKLRLWTTYHLIEPRFDAPSAQMPALGLSRAQAEAIAGYLLGVGTPVDDEPTEPYLVRRIRRSLFQPARRGALVFGLVLGAAVGAAGYHLFRRRR